MANVETHREKYLSIELVETVEELSMRWRGKSRDRDPGQFLMPLLVKTLERVRDGKKRLVIDFSEIEYMNSSTFSPIVKMLAEAQRGASRVLIEFHRGRKWQTLSFSALKAFETTDGRIAVRSK